MSETDERATGATPEQIAAAIDRELDTYGDGLASEDMRDVTETVYRQFLPYIVPPDHRIVPADAVLSEAEREAIARISEAAWRWCDHCEDLGIDSGIEPTDAAIVDAIATLRRRVAREGG